MLIREVASTLLFAALAATFIRGARRRRLPQPFTWSAAAVDLAAVYANIRRQADEKADGWPQSQTITSKLDMNAKVLRPPEFTDGHGPIGAYAMLNTPEQLRLLRWCRSAFDAFVSDLRAVMPPASLGEFERLLWINAESSYHTCVSVFHEHPTLLPKSERVKWRPVQGEVLATLGGALRDATRTLAAPELVLDSLSITADGAFIAGFCDDASTGSFARVREVCAATALSTLGGELTSRPKALIHVTLGRLLGAPDGLTDAQRGDVAALVRRHNAVDLPKIVASLAATEPHRLVMRVGALSLVRDRVWWMTEFDEYATWSLGA